MGLYAASNLIPNIINCLFLIQQEENTRRHIMDLPDEMIELILSNISTYDLLQNVSKVSKRFRDGAMSPKVHIHVRFDMRVRFYCSTLNSDDLNS